MLEFWIVVSPNGMVGSRFGVKLDAVTEAERLARLNHGQLFYICKAMAYVQAVDLVWNDCRDLPF